MPQTRNNAPTKAASAPRTMTIGMATEKLAEGIRKFYADARKLEQYALARVTQTASSR